MTQGDIRFSHSNFGVWVKKINVMPADAPDEEGDSCFFNVFLIAVVYYINLYLGNPYFPQYSNENNR
jgi:hypothetical protein